MITVIAGVNGAGKSTVPGAYIRNCGGDYFNPDEIARKLMIDDTNLSVEETNSQAWQMGFAQLNHAIDEAQDYTFETTLGGTSICQTLHEAINRGQEVRILYCGLNSLELHIQRVAERAANGGHVIPEDKIRKRWTNSIHNMMGLIPRCSFLSVFDNSIPKDDDGPKPVCLFSFKGDIFDIEPIKSMPDWARPLASEAIKKITG